MEINATLLVQAFFFIVLLTWLSKVLFKPMVALFDEREKRIEGARSQAKTVESQAHEDFEKVNKLIAQAYAEAKVILEKLKNEGSDYHRKVVEKAREEANTDIKKARAKVEQVADSIALELKEMVGPLSTEIAAKLELSPSTETPKKSEMEEAGV